MLISLPKAQRMMLLCALYETCHHSARIFLHEERIEVLIGTSQMFFPINLYHSLWGDGYIEYVIAEKCALTEEGLEYLADMLG